MPGHPPQVAHRLYADGTVDSICLRCFRTIVRAERNAMTRDALEITHNCDLKYLSHCEFSHLEIALARAGACKDVDPTRYREILAAFREAVERYRNIILADPWLSVRIRATYAVYSELIDNDEAERQG